MSANEALDLSMPRPVTEVRGGVLRLEHSEG